MDQVMVDIQAAVMAASVKGGMQMPMAQTGEIPEGVTFSDVLAAQNDISAGGEVLAEGIAEIPADDMGVPAEIFAPITFDDIMTQLDKTDNGVLKGLKMLLDAVLRAVRGNNDGQERKTDLFSMLFDGGAELSEEESDIFLLGAEIMNNIGGVIAMETESLTDTDEIIKSIDEILEKFGGTEEKDDDEDDEEKLLSIMDILSAMLNTPAEELEEYLVTDSGKAAAVSAAEEVMTYPKQAAEKVAPEKAERMERLYADYSQTLKEDVSEPENSVTVTVKMPFVSVRINNAADQVKAISGSEVREAKPVNTGITADTEETAEEIPEEVTIPENPDVNAAAAETYYVPVETEITEFTPEEELTLPEAEAIVSKVTETLTERVFEMTEQNGTEQLVIVLKPEELGQVAVKLVKENGALSVTLSAQHEAVGRMLAERAAELGGGLENRDVEVRDIQVVEPSNAAEQMGLNFTDQGFERRGEYSSGSGGNYRGTDEITDGEEPEENIEIREAKLWTTA